MAVEVDDELGTSYVVPPTDDDLADQAPETDPRVAPPEPLSGPEAYLAEFGIPGVPLATHTRFVVRFRRPLPAWTTPAFAWACAAASIVAAARVTVPSQGVTLGMGIAVGAAIGVLGVDRAARKYARWLRAEVARAHAALTRGARS
jgi:hypothetical protein